MDTGLLSGEGRSRHALSLQAGGKEGHREGRMGCKSADLTTKCREAQGWPVLRNGAGDRARLGTEGQGMMQETNRPDFWRW